VAICVEYFFKSCNCSATVVTALISINFFVARYSRMNGRQPSSAPSATLAVAMTISVCVIAWAGRQASAAATTSSAALPSKNGHLGMFHSETSFMLPVSEKRPANASAPRFHARCYTGSFKVMSILQCGQGIFSPMA
jgi:hypothetical protein